MPFPIPAKRTRDSVDALRDETKRIKSPGSFFYSQGRSQVLAARYFHDDRLADHARGGIASKHRHRIHLSMFGQLMASFEFFLKDFVAKSIDSTTLLDETIKKSKWLETDVSRILANRSGVASIGSTLVHSTMGWHSPEQVNARYQTLFSRQAFDPSERQTLEKLWVLRHSVAHNAGMIIHYDATRLGSEELADHAADIDAEFIAETFDFLSPLAQQICENCGGNLLRMHFEPLADKGPDILRDIFFYSRIKPLSEYITSRPQEVTGISKAVYNADFIEYSTPL